MNESRTFLIIGFLAAGALILALGFTLGGRSAGGAPDALAPLRILTPATGDSLHNPVTITFVTRAPLRLDSALGWVAGELHLHAMADGVEIMPAAADIAPAADAGFRWQLPDLPTGTRRIHLTWAGRHHGNLGGATDTLLLHIVP